MASSQDETRRTVSEFFVKSLNVILGARIPSKYLDLKPKDILMAAKDVNKGFNLVLVNSPLRNRCHLNAVEPIVVDVLLLQQCNNVAGPSENPRKQVLDRKEGNGMSQSLIERWVVHCVPWSSIADDSKRIEALTKKKNRGRASRPPPAPQCKASEEPWSPCKKAIRMLTIMLRSLYALTRLLPAYRLFQVLNSTADCCNFDLSYKVRTTLSASEANEETFKKFNLTPVETELGRMCISVRYSSSASVEAIERSSSIFSDIIPDYVGSAGGLSNRHIAVADMRLAAMIRTKSDNVPPLASGRTTSVGVRRTSSSPLQATKDFDNVHDQLVCPFATDDELENCQRMEPICGTSRDAAVGALITALKLATPIRRPLSQNPVTNPATSPDGEASRSEQPLQTFKHAIEDLNNYKLVSYSLSKRN